MHTPHCLRIAQRMHLLLRREIGAAVDPQRMLHEPHYAREVLLVCEALPRTELPELAAFYRRAEACPDEAELAAAKRRKGAGLIKAARRLHPLFSAPAPTAGQPQLAPEQIGSRTTPAH